MTFDGNYCRAEDQIRAWILEGMQNPCQLGQDRLDQIHQLRGEAQPKLSGLVISRIERLQRALKELDQESEKVDQIWRDFIAQGDTLYSPPRLKPAYCDPATQVKTWIMQGALDPCPSGQDYLDRISELQNTVGVAMTADMACHLNNFKRKVWDCRYWELVREARRLTAEEREKFGPLSATVMEGELNSAEQLCPTDVAYSPIGWFGLRYLVTTYLCQDIDLSRMGDPEYYQKIANWVNQEALGRYCEAAQKCKEEFYIYVEGHTDGTAFAGATYPGDLTIPEKTVFLYNNAQESVTKETKKLITSNLRDNVELGLARAWTVKEQLTFMDVPIQVGMYEHPSHEKGGDYRIVNIELNIVNMFWDFYDKTLARLILESGIGPRPDLCVGGVPEEEGAVKRAPQVRY